MGKLAKRKIRDAGIPFRIPNQAELAQRLHAVLAVVYLVFNEGYAATSGAQLQRMDLCDEAIHLGRMLCALALDEVETMGRLALLLFTHARRNARVDAQGDIVLLAAQDRTRWDATNIEEARALLRECLLRNRPGPFQLQASITAAPVMRQTFVAAIGRRSCSFTMHCSCISRRWLWQ